MEDGKAAGVRLEDGSELRSTVVLSNATPKVTFLQLLSKASVSKVNLSSLNKCSHPLGKLHI